MSESRISTRLRMLLLAAGCTAVLGLAACGGDDETTTSSTAAATTEATTTESTDTGDTTATDLDTGDAGELRDAFNQQLLQVLTTTQGLSQSQAQCAIDALEESVSDEDLQAAIEEAAQTGEPPQDLIDAGFDAGQQCAGQ